MPVFWQASAARQRMRACARGDISKHRHEVLIAVPGKTRRRRLTITNSTDVRMFRLMLAEGRSLIRQRNAIEDRAVELLGDRPDYQLLRTIPGIGPINALTE